MYVNDVKLQVYVRFVKDTCNKTIVSTARRKVVETQMVADYKSQSGSNADYYVMNELMESCFEVTNNRFCGRIGDPTNMIAYAEVSDGSYVVVFNTKEQQGYFLINTKNSSCAGPVDSRNGVIFLQQIVQGVKNETSPETIVKEYMSRFGNEGLSAEYLRIAKLAGCETKGLETHLLDKAIEYNTELLQKVSSVIRNDLW